MNQTKEGALLALDVGAKRIGVALAGRDVGFASPLTTLEHSNDIITKIADLVRDNHVTLVVVGYPRGLEGQATEQTKIVEAFVDGLKSQIPVRIEWQDESLTSIKAEAELSARHKGAMYNKADVDALAATYILEDYITEHPGEIS